MRTPGLVLMKRLTRSLDEMFRRHYESGGLTRRPSLMR